MGLAYTPKEALYISNELLLFEGFDTEDQSPIIPHEGFIWDNDWWEGQKYIKVIAIDFVQNAMITDIKLWLIEKGWK